MIAAPFTGAMAGQTLGQFAVLAFMLAGFAIMIPASITRKFGMRLLGLGCLLSAFAAVAARVVA